MSTLIRSLGRGLVPTVVSLALVLPSSVTAAPPKTEGAAPAAAPSDAPESKSKKSKSKKSKKSKSKKSAPAKPEGAAEGDGTSKAEPADAAKAADAAPEGKSAGNEPSAAGAKTSESEAGTPLEALPLELSGKLSKDARKGLKKRFGSAVSGVKVGVGGHKARMSVELTGKRSYALSLAVLGSDDAVALELQEACEGCSLDQVGERMQGLLQQAAAKLDEPKAPAPGRVAVRSTPEGATVRVDGAEQGVTPQVIELPAGEHTIAIEKAGFAAFEQKVVVEEGAELPVEATLAAAPLATPEPQGKKGKKAKAKEPVPDGPDPGRGLKIGGWVVLGAGLAGVAAGVAMILIDEKGVAGCSGEDVDFRGECRDRYDTLLGGIIGTAAGGLGVAGGLALLIHGQRVTVRARGGNKQASISLSVRF
ncbi:PEGA domain-containing protein [Paraliomyxa miuraensis]|uniref:PEGA domain-containing protein n=1 Tax=Paraliomyxa miuraensis TaxID=376150 RepID=UPI00224E2B5C|nr:PEGA domain-containing protein [Paraliomyxa miuraensis]MCX4241454.1 PEGA domain-containing protein [Paraliomyxa miuraensis]